MDPEDGPAQSHILSNLNQVISTETGSTNGKDKSCSQLLSTTSGQWKVAIFAFAVFWCLSTTVLPYGTESQLFDDVKDLLMISTWL